MRISQLDGSRVALWGWGREGRAAYHAIRDCLPALPLTLFCNAEEAAETAALQDELLKADIRVDGHALSAFDVVVKSPGISPYRPEASEAVANGTRFIGGTALWFGEHRDAEGYAPRTFCITGTKGKSTTTSLLAHLLRASGCRTALVGNIGLPLLEVLNPQPAPDYWAIELSSYQTRDVAASGTRPDVAVVLNMFPEHLDWHGGEARYIEDKLALVTEAKPRVAVMNAADPHLARLVLPDSQVRWFNRENGWHLRGDDLYRGERFVLDTTTVPLPGRHNRSNLCAVLAAIEAAGIEAEPLAEAAQSFRPLPNRLQAIGERDGILYVNDSISTTPHASLAALDCFRSHHVAILLGGHDRGLEWDDFADRMREQPPAVIVTMGANGPRIHALLEPLAQTGGFQLAAADGLIDAMAQARRLLEGRGVILLSPGAPSFGQYKDYVARGRHFAEIAGFDPDVISSIPGLGIV